MNQHEIYAANRTNDGATVNIGIRQWPASTAAATNDEHRAIADDWLRRAIGGIRAMHFDDDEQCHITVEHRRFIIIAD